MPKLTKHARKRMEERYGSHKKECEAVAKNAFRYGLKHSDLNGIVKKYVDALYLQRYNANKIRLYRGCSFLFCGGTLITMFKVPDKIWESAEQIATEKKLLKCKIKGEA